MRDYVNIFRNIFMVILIIMMTRSGYAVSMSLLDAAKNGDTETVRTLIDRGADINQQGRFGYTPLMWALEGGHTGAAILLINRGADVKIRTESGYSALSKAAAGQSRIVQLLLDKGADVNALWGEWTPLSIAAGANRSDIIKLLLDKNADIDLAIGGLESMAAKGKLIGREEAQKAMEILLTAKETYGRVAE
ncbi:MAG: ankyrin repeat domain-containing protein, partial [Syntrophales bacterium]|nr:ankyrin repeat domain-containing protein [Syntrophales bacterium]